MKRILLLLPFCLLMAAQSIHAQNDAIERFFEKYMDDEQFTVVYVSPKLFQMVGKIDADDEDWEKIRPMVANLGGLRVLTADSISDGIKMYKEALSKVPQNEYSELLTVRDGDENVRIWVKDSGDIINELLLLVGSPDEFVLLSLTGKIDLNQISELSKTLDIDGVEHLDKINKKEGDGDNK
ncbi:MAG: DUF4252 domain-containing protein [Saprospiraceae bacterium]|jgi:hypothetical protein